MFLINPYSGSSGPATVTYTDNVLSAGGASPRTFSSRDISAAAANRTVIVGVTAVFSGGGSVTGVTVGSISATQRLTVDNSGDLHEIWTAAVPTGTTADVVVTTSASTIACFIRLWAVYGLASEVPTDTGSATGGPTVSDTLNIDADGIAVANTYTANSSVTVTWTGLTERFDAQSADGSHSGASDAFAVAQVGLTIQVTYSGGAAGRTMVCASFR